MIQDTKESKKWLCEKAAWIHYLITQLKTPRAPPPFDSASFTFAHFIALSCLFDLIITIRETSQVTRWHSEFHYLSKMASGFHSTFLTGGGHHLPALEEGGYPTGRDTCTETTSLHESRRGLFVRYSFLEDGLQKFQILSHLAQPPLSKNSLTPKWNTRSFEKRRHPPFQI